MGLTDEETREVTHLAMTVGASRIKVMADAELARAEPLTKAGSDAPVATDAQTAAAAPRPAPGFVAAEAGVDADGG